MKRRDVLTGGIALAAATILPALPALAEPKSKQTYVLFTRYGYGYATMKVLNDPDDVKKGMVMIPKLGRSALEGAKWSKYYLIKATADMDIPTESNPGGPVAARIVKRHVAWVEDLKAQAISYGETHDMMFRRARTMHYCESQYGPCRLEAVPVNHEVMGEIKFFHAYDANNQFRGSFFAGAGSV
jgi:hypothetical protein